MLNRILPLTLVSVGLTAGSAIGQNPSVAMETTLGTMVIELDAEKAPKTVANFLAYVDDGFYDGTIFHRVIPGFMIQGGGFTAAMNQKETKAPIENEGRNGLANARGTISMARTGDPHSATAQFFINSQDNDGLDASREASGWGYAVFGKVTSGEEVIDEISGVRTHTAAGGHQNVPAEAVTIISVKRQ